MNNHTRFSTTRRMRLKGFNYGSPGYYFITYCQRDRLPLFVDVAKSKWTLTPSGEMVRSAISEMESRFHDVQVDSFAIMPNHIHLLIGLSITMDANETDSVIDAIHWIKTVTTTRYIQGVKNLGWPRINGQLWQDGYHDRIVRNDAELETIRKYIHENPMRWREDDFYEP